MRYAVWSVAATILLGALMNLHGAGAVAAKGRKKIAQQMVSSVVLNLAEVTVLVIAGFHL